MNNNITVPDRKSHLTKAIKAAILIIIIFLFFGSMSIISDMQKSGSMFNESHSLSKGIDSNKVDGIGLNNAHQIIKKIDRSAVNRLNGIYKITFSFIIIVI